MYLAEYLDAALIRAYKQVKENRENRVADNRVAAVYDLWSMRLLWVSAMQTCYHLTV